MTYCSLILGPVFPQLLKLEVILQPPTFSQAAESPVICQKILRVIQEIYLLQEGGSPADGSSSCWKLGQRVGSCLAVGNELSKETHVLLVYKRLYREVCPKKQRAAVREPRSDLCQEPDLGFIVMRSHLVCPIPGSGLRSSLVACTSQP